MEELSMLKSLCKKSDIVFTEKSDFMAVDWCDNLYCVPQINRKEILFLPKFIIIFLKSLLVLIKEKPYVIVSTGALATFPICLLGRVLRKKIIYIESFARINKKSMTGNAVYRFADLFIVQWEEMIRLYPKAKYGGKIF